MDFNSTIYVIDKKDKKPYACKIVAVNKTEDKIKIHFKDWSDSHDEWIRSDSDRIVEIIDDYNTDQSKQPVNPQNQKCEEILGRLLKNSNDIQKKVISGFNHKESCEKNAKQLAKFQVPMLEDTAELLKIEFEDENSKRLYSKSMLIKKLINKINAILPLICPECRENYSMDLEEQALFTCQLCDRGAHNCDSMKQFHASMPASVPKGFVWICPACIGFSDNEETHIEIPEIHIEKDSQNAVVKSHASNNQTLTAESSELKIAQHQLPQKNVPITSKTSYICPKYRKGVCPHGLRGNKLLEGEKCKFEYPRACRKYSSFGSRGRNGCRLDSNCRYYHPILCRYSVSERLCLNEKCTFVHLKGTRRHEDSAVPSTMLTPPQATSRKHVPSLNQAPFLTGGNVTSVGPKNDFLSRIETMIKELKLSQETEMNHLRQEINYLKSMNLQPRWGLGPPLYHPHHPNYAHQTYSQAALGRPVQPQASFLIANTAQKT